MAPFFGRLGVSGSTPLSRSYVAEWAGLARAWCACERSRILSIGRRPAGYRGPSQFDLFHRVDITFVLPGILRARRTISDARIAFAAAYSRFRTRRSCLRPTVEAPVCGIAESASAHPLGSCRSPLDRSTPQSSRRDHGSQPHGSLDRFLQDIRCTDTGHRTRDRALPRLPRQCSI